MAYKVLRKQFDNGELVQRSEIAKSVVAQAMKGGFLSSACISARVTCDQQYTMDRCLTDHALHFFAKGSVTENSFEEMGAYSCSYSGVPLTGERFVTKGRPACSLALFRVGTIQYTGFQGFKKIVFEVGLAEASSTVATNYQSCQSKSNMEIGYSQWGAIE
ncbi:hypothetical protein T265_12067 [Opisthorchis viverrini]|uniref:Uncharacterized protein n=1 Tax=Opisthorchis viverrini TaxID=6198 RepID=A0A074Z6X3_OPIVI|nr:hypothetical protein T265_12067 [Opisthorchis viverrini]KER18985.1 hypothetical protein T265_12067 [Opisthorchis viverrini]